MKEFTKIHRVLALVLISGASLSLAWSAPGSISTYLATARFPVMGIDLKGNIWIAAHPSSQDPVVISKFDPDGNVLFLNKKTAYPPETFKSRTDLANKLPEYNAAGLSLIIDAFGNPLLFWRVLYRRSTFLDPRYDKMRILSLTSEGDIQADKEIPNIRCSNGLHAVCDGNGEIHFFHSDGGGIEGYLRIEKRGKEIRVLKHFTSPATSTYARFYVNNVPPPYFAPLINSPFSFLPMDDKRILVCVQPEGYNDGSLTVYTFNLQVHQLPKDRQNYWLTDEQQKNYERTEDEVKRLLKGKLVDDGFGLFDFSNIQFIMLQDYAFRKYPGLVVPSNDLVKTADGNFVLSARTKDEQGSWAVYQVRIGADGKVIKPAKIDVSEPRNLTDAKQVMRLHITSDTKAYDRAIPKDGRYLSSGPLSGQAPAPLMVYGFDGEGYLYYKPITK